MAQDSEIKLVELVFKRPDISDERFHHHWKVIHGPLGAGMRHLYRYVQLHRIHPFLPGMPPIGCEGVVEGYFHSRATLEETFTETAFLERTKPDEPLFLDVGRLTPILTGDQVVVPGPPDRRAGAKAALLLRRAPNLEIEEFRERSARFAQRLAEVCDPQHLTHAVALQSEYAQGEPVFDSFHFLAWPDVFALEEAWSAPQVKDALRELSSFADVPGCAGFLAEEHRVTWPQTTGEGGADD